jgi:polysaccharide chain length determinant protein (PEP-CTERM system associated)
MRRRLPRREPLQYLELPLRHPLLFAVPTLLMTLAAVALALWLPDKYRSSTLILVEADPVPETVVPRMATQPASKRLATLKQEILSRTRLEKVLAELKPYPEKAGMPIPTVVEHMRRDIFVGVKGTDAFSVEYVHTDPHMAMTVANRLVNLFVEETSRARETQVKEAYEFIDQQVASAKQALDENEEQLLALKESRLGALPEQLGANLAILQRLQLELQTVEANLTAVHDRHLLLERMPLTAAPPAATAAGPLAELASLRAQHALLRMRYTDAHPDVRLIAARVRRLEQAVATLAPAEASPAPDRAITPQLLQAKTDIARLEARRSELSQQIRAFQARVEATPRTEQETAALVRDNQKLKDNYLKLLSTKQNAEMAARLEERWKGERFRVLDSAYLPERPYFPNRPLFAAAGLLLGLVTGVGLTLARENLDHSVRDLAELSVTLPYPVLAVLPHLSSPRGVEVLSPPEPASGRLKGLLPTAADLRAES